MVRIAVLTDAHANLPALRAALDAIRREGCDAIYHTGDAIAIGPHPAECVELLLSTPQMHLLMGNHDAWFAYGLPQPQPEWLSDGEVAHQLWTHAQLNPALRATVGRWPYVVEKEFDGIRATLLHYEPAASASGFAPFQRSYAVADYDRVFAQHDADLVFYGHTHVASDLRGRARYINPGSLGCHRQPVARYVVLECARRSYTLSKRAVPYDDAELFAAFERRKVPERASLYAAFYGGRYPDNVPKDPISGIVGLERGLVRLEPYTSQWATLYREEEHRLDALIGPHVIDIQHIGSTAIPGMIAKPIIDFGVAIVRFEEGFNLVAPIESLGYEYAGENGIPRRHYYVKGDPRTHHLHMLEHDSAEWRNHILFRDYLREHAQTAQEYADLKRGLAQKYRHDRAAYTDGKAEFIARVLEMARRDKLAGECK